MPITPDTKDWTWVLERRCPECGFQGSDIELDQLGDVIRALGPPWGEVVASPDAAVRPSDDRWSPLEYACHVRDVFRVYDERLELMLREDDPGFPNWDQDASAIDDAYATQDPATVARELVEAADALAARFEAVQGAQWQRTGSRSDGADFTIETFARYFVHDPIHHLVDVGVTFDR
jgi:hypothetical protein